MMACLVSRDRPWASSDLFGPTLASLTWDTPHQRSNWSRSKSLRMSRIGRGDRMPFLAKHCSRSLLRAHSLKGVAPIGLGLNRLGRGVDTHELGQIRAHDRLLIGLGQRIQLVNERDRVEHALRVRVVRAEDHVLGADELDQA